MRVKNISQDADYGIFVGIEADDGEKMDFYFCSRTGKVIGPQDGFTPEQFQLALETSRQAGI
jgi:hypothetical protein